MSVQNQNEKFRFLRKWTLINAIVIIVIYPIVLLIGLFVSEAMGYSMDEWGTPLEQTLMQIGFGTIIGFGIGITQRILLKKVFNVSSLWSFMLVLGLISTELIVGVFCWKLDINRGDLSFVENNPLPHALIATISGLLIGILQLPLLKKYYSGAGYWIAANAMAWGLSILIMAIKVQSDIFLLISFIIGAILYGAITGATFIWLMKLKSKEINFQNLKIKPKN